MESPRHWLVVGLVGLILSLISQMPVLVRLDGLSIDTLFWLRHQIYGPTHSRSESPAVVIGLDEETYRQEPFQGLPKAMWTPQLAQVLNAVLDAGAQVIGQDLILSTSVERYFPGYDRDYLLALRRGAEDGRLVLGKVQHLQKPLSPFAGHSFAIGHQSNIRLVNLFRDNDGVIRRVPLVFQSVETSGETRLEPSMALELAARARGIGLQLPGTQGPLDLDGYPVPGARKNAMLLNFETGGGGIPTFSFADLYACAKAGQQEFFQEHFADRVVVLGGVLDVEDRKLTSKRFATGSEGAWTGPRCQLPVMETLYDERVVRDTIPGVYIFATAVNNLLRGDALRELPAVIQFSIVLLCTLAAGYLGFTLMPPIASPLIVFGIGVWLVVSTIVFRHGTVLPLVDALAASVIAFGTLIAYRIGVTDREKRAVRRAFSYYLPDTVIDRMLSHGAIPKLGGETRELTVMFSDIAGFTALSEGIAPSEIVRIMNAYLSTMTDIIEDHGGFVDKYIGDAIVAVFGAPLEDAEHARHAVEAALACQSRLNEIGPSLGLPKGRRVTARIGINSGSMLLGNIGSHRRFNYTVMGDAVNLASRLEGVNRLYQTGILAADATAGLCSDQIAFREIDRVRVLGRKTPVVLYQPLGPIAEQDEKARARLAQFSAALKSLRSTDYVAAARLFETLGQDDPVAACMAARAKHLAESPPGEDWDGVRDLDVK